ncbi:MAG: outer membrane beta-barrel protein, partial [Sediminibacterium sp.]|nr:outer membrane beta-barrel protein [Sediminibacterium sp.]
SGNADVYYNYDINGHKNIPTYFNSQYNSTSIGMVDLKMVKKGANIQFVGEVSAGKRSDESIGNNNHVQNLYINYSINKKWSIVCGFMSSFIGYESINPLNNFHYSTAYLFSVQPFQNNGIKLVYNPNDKLSIMIGNFNNWNYLADNITEMSDIGTEVHWTPNINTDFLFHFLEGRFTGKLFDFCSTFILNEKNNIGLNFTDFNEIGEMGAGYTGIVIYHQYSFTKKIVLGYRLEHFINKSDKIGKYRLGVSANEHVDDFTMSLNLINKNLRFIPSFRYDIGSNNLFLDNNLKPINNTFEISLAAVYSF